MFHYWLEYRQRLGFDEDISREGVVIRLASDLPAALYSGSVTFLPDPYVLIPGSVFVDSQNEGLSIQVLEMDPNGARVEITYD